MRGLLIWILLLVIAGVAYAGYWAFYTNNISPTDRRVSLNIPTGSDMAALEQQLVERHILSNMSSYQLTARVKGFDRVIAGHYVFNKRMNNREIVNMLQRGIQTPIKLNIYNVRTPSALAGLVGRTLEIDSTALLAVLTDTAYCHRKGLNTENILTHYIVDNYEMRWNTPIADWDKMMDSLYLAYWTPERQAAAAALSLSPTEVMILAAIVEKECILDRELPVVAGVYLNRLRINMPLQADPTLVFAAGDYAAQRVTARHKAIESPYNTYLHRGLPPGPICMPRKKSINAVLHPEQHEYIYFCANPDMSGNSLFSRTLEEQNRVANSYRKKLDSLNIH
jgi:UPF0755 protein